MRKFEHVFGVDFSGSAAAGRNTWIAEARPIRSRLRLVALDSLENITGSCERGPALNHLVELIAESREAIWGIDFPFGLPIELSAIGSDWPTQLNSVSAHSGDAKTFGLWCVEQTKRFNGKLHLRRTTDTETRTPFDCYHYRIIYQTFHGMRDVLRPLAASGATAILPFRYDRLRRARNAVVEACPSSTLKRLNLPHQNYKQPTGGPLSVKRLRTRHEIIAGLEKAIEISIAMRKIMLRNPGGDALDAVIAAVGTWQSFSKVDHAAIRTHGRYPREGFIYA